MERAQETRNITQLEKGIKVKNIYPRAYGNGKVYYDVKLPEEKMIIYIEAEVKLFKTKESNILVKIIHAYQMNQKTRTPIDSKLNGRILKIKQPDNFHSTVASPVSFSLSGTLILQ